MVTIGNGTTAKVTADMAKLGTNLLFVRPGQFGPGRASQEAKPFNIRDIEALRAELSGVRAVAPRTRASATIVYGTENRNSTVMGTDNAFFTTQDWNLQSGRQFLDSEVRGGRTVCIIGNTVRRELFGPYESLGRRLRVNKVSCEVIGILETKGESSFGTDQDDVVIMPLRAFQRRIAGNTDISDILVSAEHGVETAKVQTAIERLMRERRGITAGKEDDFSVGDLSQIAATATGMTQVLTGLLGAVAGVSLLVGGIGIMNIMLVSVTERTREIGIRLAIGALERQVLLQFLVEAVVLSLFGGLVGILIGLGLAWLATAALSVPFAVHTSIILTAFPSSALVCPFLRHSPARPPAPPDPTQAPPHE